MFLALLAEALLVLVVITLGSTMALRDEKDASPTVVSFKASNQAQDVPPAPKETKPDTRQEKPSPREATETVTTTAPLPRPRVDAPTPSLIRLSPSDMAAADIASIPRQPAKPGPATGPKMGPPDTGGATSDTPRVSGSGPNGEPLYAASWYREPYDDELRGYLSTASGPGWGLIACRTAPDYRVEDCVKVDEYPSGSNIARSVLAAAWQFRVRPPRIGGEPKIGEWVRIRIDYDLRR